MQPCFLANITISLSPWHKRAFALLAMVTERLGHPGSVCWSGDWDSLGLLLMRGCGSCCHKGRNHSKEAPPLPNVPWTDKMSIIQHQDNKWSSRDCLALSGVTLGWNLSLPIKNDPFPEMRPFGDSCTTFSMSSGCPLLYKAREHSSTGSDAKSVSVSVPE